MAQDDIQGQVVDGSGNPVSGAIVELTRSYQASPTDEQVVRRVTTDSNGNYIFEEHPDGDGTTQEWHVSAYSHDGTAYVNSFNNPGVTADLPEFAIPDGLVDNFEGVPDGPYASGDDITTYYAGDTGDVQRVPTTIMGGDVGLGVNDGGFGFPDSDGITSLSGDGLPNYFPKGEVARVRLRDEFGDGPLAYIGVASGDAGVAIGLNIDQELLIKDRENGSTLSTVALDTSYADGDVIELYIERHDGTSTEPDDEIVVTLYALDTSFNRDGVLASNTTSLSRISDNDGVGFGSWSTYSGQTVAYGEYYAGDSLP